VACGTAPTANPLPPTFSTTQEISVSTADKKNIFLSQKRNGLDVLFSQAQFLLILFLRAFYQGDQKHNDSFTKITAPHKVFYKKIDQKSVPFFHVFGHFSVRGVKKHHK
jgi:hypothetical protein